jgi:hypothetical protein
MRLPITIASVSMLSVLSACGPSGPVALGSTPTGAPEVRPATLPPAWTATITPTRTRTRTAQPSQTTTPSWTPRAPYSACDDAPPSQLHGGERAYIAYAPPDPNRLHETPGLSAPLVSWLLQPGQEVAIVGGPECADEMVWWQVRVPGTQIEGWTAEGDAQAYWLLPAE